MSDAAVVTEPATLGARFLALMVDWILCVLIAGLLAPAPWSALVANLVLVGEYAIFIGFFGQTIGMRLAKIRCVTSEGRPPGIWRAAVRGALLCLVVPALIMDRDGRGIHDRAVGTTVLRA